MDNLSRIKKRMEISVTDFLELVGYGLTTGILAGLIRNFAYSVTGTLYGSTKALVRMD